MPYLIDSDWVIDFLAQESEALQLVEQLAQEGIAISIVTYMEVYQGVLRSQESEAASAQFAALVAAVPVLPFSRAVAERCVQLRETLRQQGKRPQQRALDLIIAATALTNDLVLVTRNVADYKDLPDLALWERR